MLTQGIALESNTIRLRHVVAALWPPSFCRVKTILFNEAILSKNQSDAKLRAEAAFTRNQKRESEVNDALKEEQARHAAAVKNMHRLRALRLEQNAASSANADKVVRADKTSGGHYAQARGRAAPKT